MGRESTQLSEAPPAATAARKRAAVETIAREGAELRKAARRYSLCEEDAEDAYQRALEILLVKAPTDRLRELAPWAKTVIKHEALAIRHYRERMLGREDDDPGAWIPARGDGPDERAEVGERVARSREALRTLKPAELRSLTLLAAGYSYAEIGEITGFSQTKVNRCLAEGRDRFRRHLTSSEDGSRCAEMSPLLSAYCDGEARAEDAATVRAHLRACAACRATMRAYRAAPVAAAALAPLLPASRTLLERAQDLLLGLQTRLPGGGGGADAGAAQVAAAGGARGAGAAALAKLLAVCAGTVGGATACVATGIAPAPFDLAPSQKEMKVERVSERVLEASAEPPIEPAPPAAPAGRKSTPPEEARAEQAPAAAAPVSVSSGAAEAAEYVPPEPAPAPSPEPAPPPTTSSDGSAGSPAGEFGP